MLDLLIRLILSSRKTSQDELTDEQLAALGEQLVKGEVSQAEAVVLLDQRARRGDRRSIDEAMEYLAALGMDGEPVLRVASNFYFAYRYYDEAQRHAQTLCYEHERYGRALRQLAIIDVLQGDYVSALVHIDEYLEQNEDDPELRSFQVGALLRSGALTAAAELNRAFGMNPPLDRFLAWRTAGKSFGRFSWHGAPTRSGNLTPGVDVYRVRRVFQETYKQPLSEPVKDMAMLDLQINVGAPIEDVYAAGASAVRAVVVETSGAGSVVESAEFARWAWVNLCRLGYPARFMVGDRYDVHTPHAWVSIHRGQSVQVLECMPQGFNPPIRAQAAVEYRPRWSIDRNLHCYRH